MINWDEKPDWADRVVLGHSTDWHYWASKDRRKVFGGHIITEDNGHTKDGWQTICPPSSALYVAEKEEHTGLSVDYYRVEVANPTTAEAPYTAECNDIIEALGMNYAEGNVFKANWRRAAERTLGKRKKGNNSRYDAEKMVFFSDRILKQEDNE